MPVPWRHGQGVLIWPFGAFAGNPHSVNQKLTDNLLLSVSGKVAFLTADYLDISRASYVMSVGSLPDWCKPVPSGINNDDSYIGYLFVRGTQSYGQIMVMPDGDVTAYSNVTGAYHSGQVAFLIE